jgi:hypothetical protein
MDLIESFTPVALPGISESSVATVKSAKELITCIRNISSAEFAKFMVSEAAKWMRVVKEAGIKGE